jgi:hypothetical protein
MERLELGKNSLPLGHGQIGGLQEQGDANILASNRVAYFKSARDLTDALKKIDRTMFRSTVIECVPEVSSS